MAAVFSAAVLILLIATRTWRAVRALRRVVAIQEELAVLNDGDVSGRVHEPSGAGVVTGLALAVNETLGRLDGHEERTERVIAERRRFASDATLGLCGLIAGLRERFDGARRHPGETAPQELVASALRDVNRLEAVALDLLFLIRLGTDAPILNRIDLAELTRAEICARVDPHTVSLLATPGVLVDAAPAQIGRALANLLDHAQRHAKCSVRVEIGKVGGSAELTVSGDGKGIVAAADRGRVFERFGRSDAACGHDGASTGLGLAVAASIAAAHHGELHAEDSLTGGARFVLRLPLAGEVDRVS